LFSQTENVTFREDVPTGYFKNAEGDIVRVNVIQCTIECVNLSSSYSFLQGIPDHSLFTRIFTDVCCEALIDLYSEHVKNKKKFFEKPTGTINRDPFRLLSKQPHQ
jgi:hypothetical protein